MVLIPPGEFTMGTPEGSDGFPDEHPERRVYLSGYLIDRFEVTNQAYAAFVHATGHRAPENSNRAATLWVNNQPLSGIEQHPVVNVSWTDADAYCRWVGKRLPTEAEWEKARAERMVGATLGEMSGTSPWPIARASGRSERSSSPVELIGMPSGSKATALAWPKKRGYRAKS
ncbi:MAG: formylglycine-generating enzyme family protein [Nitrospira sp.]|nr:formylglycine-generating enzyme family protein [Nitrospira sp.]